MFGDLGISRAELVAANGERIKATPDFAGNFMERQYKGVWFDFWEREEPVSVIQQAKSPYTQAPLEEDVHVH